MEAGVAAQPGLDGRACQLRHGGPVTAGDADRQQRRGLVGRPGVGAVGVQETDIHLVEVLLPAGAGRPEGTLGEVCFAGTSLPVTTNVTLFDGRRLIRPTFTASGAGSAVFPYPDAVRSLLLEGRASNRATTSGSR